MKCPKCQSGTYILESRSAQGRWTGVRRRRRCKMCGHKFSTLETIAALNEGSQLEPACTRRPPVQVLITVDEVGKVFVSQKVLKGK